MLQLKSSGFKEAMDTMKLLSLPSNMRRKYLARMGRMAIAQTKANVKAQKTVSGAPMAPRKREPQKERPVYFNGKFKRMKKVKGKMFSDMVKGKYLRVVTSPDSATVSFGGADRSGIASRHHHGGEESFSLKIKAQFPQADYNEKCNESQAITLARIGISQNGKRVGKEWIMTHMTVGHAAKILAVRKKLWEIKTPARPILGASQEQITTWGDFLITSLNEKFRAKQYAHTLV